MNTNHLIAILDLDLSRAEKELLKTILLVVHEDYHDGLLDYIIQNPRVLRRDYWELAVADYLIATHPELALEFSADVADLLAKEGSPVRLDAALVTRILETTQTRTELASASSWNRLKTACSQTDHVRVLETAEQAHAYNDGKPVRLNNLLGANSDLAINLARHNVHALVTFIHHGTSYLCVVCENNGTYHLTGMGGPVNVLPSAHAAMKYFLTTVN